MLPLHTQAIIEGVEAPLVLKVVTLEEMVQKGWQLNRCALWIPEGSDKLFPPSIFSLPWGACITCNQPDRAVFWHGPWIHSLREMRVVAPGDVIVIRPQSPLIKV
jgi:hypothetical protein